MSCISGKDNEYEFVKYLNGKTISELNPMFRDLIDELFPDESVKSEIKCWQNHFKEKSDIFIKINNKTKGISIKKGIKNSVHVERISDFIHFLIDNEVDREIIIEYLKYHYADGSTNGKGKNRISAEEYKKEHQDQIDKINTAFNNKKLLEKAIERFITKGKNSKYYIDAIIYGEVNDFIWATKEDIEQIMLSKKDEYSSAVHFSLMTCQPKNRCLNYNPLYEHDRYCIQIKWYNIFDDILEHMNKKCLQAQKEEV